jgi:methylenetetrahydrofolate reductase (NADPH)
VVDFTAFLIWKDEAFSNWKKWASIYEEGSTSKQVLDYIHQNFYLMNIVDNDFIGSNLNQIIFEFLLKTNNIVKEIKEKKF